MTLKERLLYVSRQLHMLLKAMILFAPALVIVILLYYCSMELGQAVDVLVQAGEYTGPAVCTLLAIIFWSYVVWYSSRIMSLVPQRFKGESGDIILSFQQNPYVVQMPRFLAYNCYIAIQAAVLALRSGCNLGFWEIVAFVGAHWVFYYALIQVIQLRKRGAIYWFLWLCGIGYALMQIYIAFCFYRQLSDGVFTDPERHKFWLHLESIVLFGLQILSFWFYTRRKGRLRTRLFGQRRYPHNERLLERMGLNPDDATMESPYFLVLNILTLFGVGLYTGAVLSIRISDIAGPMTIALLAFTVITGFFNLLKALSRRTDLWLGIMLLVLAYGISSGHDPYQVRLYPAQQAYAARPNAGQFLNRWLHDPQRWSEIQACCNDTTDTSRYYTAYIVLCDGGGARAGTWAGMVMAYLQDTTQGNFGKHIFAMAGASGGSLGNTSFYSLLKAQAFNDWDSPDKTFSGHIRSFYSADFLTYPLARFLGPDFLRYLVPARAVHDRAAALERAFESSSKDALLNRYFAMPLDKVFDYSGRLPALFITTTSVQDGIPGIISNVDVQNDPRYDVIDTINKHNKSMNLSTATLLSARFPFVSPAGQVEAQYFVDGGYFDNTGAGATLAFLREADSVRMSLSPEVARHLRFQVIRIHNSEVIAPPPTPIKPMVNDLFTPILTLAGMQGSSTQLGYWTLNSYLESRDPNHVPLVIDLYNKDYSAADCGKDCHCIKRSGNDKLEEDYPLSWVNSDYQLHRMRERLKHLTLHTESDLVRIRKSMIRK